MAPDHLSTTFAALADPTRRAILACPTSGEASVTELAEPVDKVPKEALFPVARSVPRRSLKTKLQVTDCASPEPTFSPLPKLHAFMSMGQGYLSFAYSAFACCRIGMSTSASFQSVKKS
jgi:hypothetical protein